MEGKSVSPVFPSAVGGVVALRLLVARDRFNLEP